MLSVLATLMLVPSSSYAFVGRFAEGCSCRSACAFELRGKNPGCSAAGAFKFDQGSFAGRSFNGGKVAFVAGSSGWLRLYYDGPNKAAREATRDFMLAAFKDWGKPEAIEHRPITLAGSGGSFIVQIEDGKILDLQTDPVLNEGRPIEFKNISNRALHPNIMQAKTMTCRFQEGGRKMYFENTNGFFYDVIRARGEF